jgi:hypothetical protein
MFSLCSNGVKVAKTPISTALAGQEVERGLLHSARRCSVAFIYSRDDLHAQKWGDYNQHLTSDEARRVASAIARWRTPERRRRTETNFIFPKPNFDET